MSDEPDPDLLAYIDSIEPFLELLRGTVAVFRNEGFSDEQARALTVKVIAGYPPIGEPA